MRGPWLAVLSRARHELDAAFRTYTAHAGISDLDDVAVHLRTGDVIYHASKQYGLPRVADLAREIAVRRITASNATATVALVTQHYSACTYGPGAAPPTTRCAADKKKDTHCCDCASIALVGSFRSALEHELARVHRGGGGAWRVLVRDADPPLAAMARIALAPAGSFCISSTFCLWPALAAARGVWPAGSKLFAGADIAEELLAPGFVIARAMTLVPYALLHKSHAKSCAGSELNRSLIANGVIEQRDDHARNASHARAT